MHTETMKNIQHNITVRMVKLLNVLLMTGSFALCWYLCYAAVAAPDFKPLERAALPLLYALLYMAFVRVYDAVQLSISRISELITGQTLAFLVSDGIIYLFICVLARRFLILWPGIACIVLQGLLSIAWSYTAHRWYFTAYPPSKTAVLYQSRAGMEDLITRYGLSKRFAVELVLPVEELPADFSMLEPYDTVFASGIPSDTRNELLQYCVENGKVMYVLPCVGDVIMSGAKRLHLFHLPMLQVSSYNPHPEYLAAKRLFDIAFSLLGILLFWPFMLVTALVIHCYDGGPAIYRQIRLTQNGREFEMLKFRSMRVDAEANGVARLSSGENDDRITPVGRIIRKIRFDELPQLFNILKGDLAIVGPRPERPEIAKQYCEELPEFRLRLQCKAGLTGYAQVYGKYNTTPADKLRLDLMYIANPGLLEDLLICFATVKTLFMPDSTEGIDESQTTALKEKE